MSQPLLSICIPTYNRSKRLERLLNNLAAQIDVPEIRERVEIVISDNSSSDSTQKVGEKWAALQSFIHYFRNPWNIGGDPNQLRVITRATGVYAWVLGDDDHVHAGGIARVLTYLKPGVTQLFLDFQCITTDGEVLSTQRLHRGVPDDVTTVDLVKSIGYVTVYALISSHVFDRERLLATEPERFLKISPWYILSTVLIGAFHDEKCVLVRDPILDYTAGNDRLPDESALYVRVMGLLNGLRELERAGKIDEDFLFGLYETSAGNRMTLVHPHYFREELYDNLTEFFGYWALPGRNDSRVIRDFVDRGPGFWGIRMQLKSYFIEDFNAYRQHKKPIIHYWHGKAWSPAFSLLLSSDDRKECEAFDRLMAKWPEQFAHESILISRLPEEEVYYEHIDVFMAPYRPHRAPSASLNSGFRKALAPRVLVLDQVCSPVMPEVIKLIDDWDEHRDAPAACLLFESASSDGAPPKGLLGLYLRREEFTHLGAFENKFENWPRHVLIADAALRLPCQARAVNGGEVSVEALDAWFAAELPGWLRALRRIYPRPLSEHGLNITQRHHLQAVRKRELT